MTSRYRSSAAIYCWTRHSLAEDTACFVDAVDQPVDLLGHRVEVEARAVRGRHAEPRHQRLAAVVTGADRDALGIEHPRDVVWMDALDVEGHDSGAAVGRWSVEHDPGDLSEALERDRRELLLVRLDRLDPDRGQVVDRGSEPDRLGDRHGAGLELVRDLAPGCLLETDLADHVATEVEGLHRLEELAAAPERTDACWAAHLVRRQRQEVAAQRLDVHRMVGRSLGGVHDHDRALLVRPSGELLNGVDRPKRVGDEIGRDSPHLSVACELVERIELELAVVVDAEHPEVGTGSLGHVLPRDEVRVVLELRDDGDVAGAKVVQAPCVGNEVQRLRRLAREDDLPRRRRVDEGGHLLAGELELRGRAFGERVDTAVHVRVRGLVERAHRVEYLTRLLRGDRRIQVRKRLAVDLLLEDRKIGSQTLRIEPGFSPYGHTAIVSTHRGYEAAFRRKWGHPR